MDRAAIGHLVRVVIADPLHRTSPTPAVATLLVREYVRSGSEEVRRAADATIARALEVFGGEPDACERLQWIRTFAETANWCEDTELGRWAEGQLPAALDAVESLVRRAYEPGEGLVGQPLAEHLQCAMSLLAGFELSGRLPYAMLAEELIQSSRRAWWDGSRSHYQGGFRVNCRAVRVLCALAALRADADYVRRAVVAPDESYRGDAASILNVLAWSESRTPSDAAEHAVAMLDWFALNGNLH